MFSQFTFEYKILKSELSSKRIDEEAFKSSTTKESDLIILMTGKIQGVFFFNSIQKGLNILLKITQTLFFLSIQ